jgi:hypothetical protein
MDVEDKRDYSTIERDEKHGTLTKAAKMTWTAGEEGYNNNKEMMMQDT